ncbi:MAG: hypothetical protein WA303_00080, partial [Bradyrhizobium sp.]
MALAKSYDGGRQANQDQRTRVADTSLNAVLQFAPVRRRHAELVGNELVGPGVSKRNGVPVACNPLHHVPDLAPRWIEANPFHIFMRVDAIVIGEAADKTSDGILQARSAG